MGSGATGRQVRATDLQDEVTVRLAPDAVHAARFERKRLRLRSQVAPDFVRHASRAYVSRVDVAVGLRRVGDHHSRGQLPALLKC